MANTVEIIAAFKDLASESIQKLGGHLENLTKVGIEPISKLSPTAGAGLERLVKAAGPGGLVMGALAGATVAAGGAIFQMAKATADAQGKLYDLSLRTGASVETLSAFDLAAKQAGVSIEDVAGSFKFMQVAITAADKGTAGAADKFDALGIAIGDLKALQPEQQFAVLAERIASIQDPAQKAAAAVEIFGKAGATLLPLLEDVKTKGLAGVTEEARKLGLIVGTDAAKAADAFGDELVKLEAVATSFGRSIGTAVIPHVTSFIQETQTGIAAIKAGAAELAATISDLFTKGFSGAAEGKTARFAEEAAKAQFAAIEKASAQITDLEERRSRRSVEIIEFVSEKDRAALAKSVDASHAAALERVRIEAEAAGNRGRVLEVEFTQRIALLDKETQALVDQATKSIDNVKTREAAIDAILKAAQDKRLGLQAKFEADRIALAVKASEQIAQVYAGNLADLQATFNDLRIQHDLLKVGLNNPAGAAPASTTSQTPTSGATTPPGYFNPATGYGTPPAASGGGGTPVPNAPGFTSTTYGGPVAGSAFSPAQQSQISTLVFQGASAATKETISGLASGNVTREFVQSEIARLETQLRGIRGGTAVGGNTPAIIEAMKEGLRIFKSMTAEALGLGGKFKELNGIVKTLGASAQGAAGGLQDLAETVNADARDRVFAPTGSGLADEAVSRLEDTRRRLT